MVQIPGPSEDEIHDTADAFETKTLELLRTAVAQVADTFSGSLDQNDLAPLRSTWQDHITETLLPMIRSAYVDAARQQRERQTDALTASADPAPAPSLTMPQCGRSAVRLKK